MRTLVGSSDAGVRTALVQPDGKIVVAGLACERFFIHCTFAVARYGSGGSLDAAFGGTGVIVTDVGFDESQAKAAALQPDGKIIVVGSATEYVTGIGYGRFALVRYRTDGSLDSTFGNGGIVTTRFDRASTPSDVAHAVAVDADGGIVVAGSALVENGGSSVTQFALARYDAHGTLDPGFGEGGKVVTVAGNQSTINALALDTHGRIVAAGTADDGHFQFALARYLHDGSLDLAFGRDGIVLTDIAGAFADIRGIALQSDDKIIGAGFALNAGANGSFAVARYSG